MEFHYVVTKTNKRQAGTSSLFSFEWLAKLFDVGQDDAILDAKARTLDGEVTAKLKLKSVSVSESVVFLIVSRFSTKIVLLCQFEWWLCSC